MKDAAIGVRMHSGWGVLVAISGDGGSVELLDRRRIATADDSIPGAYQPYHYAAKLRLPEAEEYIARCAVVSERLARAALSDVVRYLKEREYRVDICAVLTASGRPLPPLANILALHPLRHTAEGVFFRYAVSAACDYLQLATVPIRERDLSQSVDATFGKAGRRLRESIANMRPGPPWTMDHKNAALAALLGLRGEGGAA